MLHLTRISVDSSMLSAVAYDKASKTLFAEFNSGAVWAYDDVPEEVFDDLLNAKS